MKRVWHPYTAWEEVPAGMWETLSKEQEEAILPRAVEFTGNHKLYGLHMIRVVEEWPVSCEHNLTNTSMNRRAWVGHAAVALAFGCPEYVTRMAWWKLTQQQRDEADAQADKAIRYFLCRWKRTGDAQYEFPFLAEDPSLHISLGEAGIPVRHTGRSTAEA